MEPKFLSGLALLAVGLVGYAVGVVVPYPGRAFSLTAVMAGITALVIAQRSRGEPA